jgi:hypothetical protein
MKSSRFTPSAFADPPKEFRPLQIVHGFDGMLHDQPNLAGEAGIDTRLDKLLSLGIGGVVANVGFRDYLESPRQWEIYRYGLQAAAAREMALWWYDEKGYPSGTAGGIVTRSHPEFASLGLACYHIRANGPDEVVFARPASCRAIVWAGAIDGDLREACRDRFIDLCGCVEAGGTLRWTPPAGHWTVLVLAERVNPATMIPSGTGEELRHYVNLLDPHVAAEFIRVTHEAYFRETPPDLWKRIQAVFTDEPTLHSEYGAPTLAEPKDGHDHPPFVPWLGTFLESFSDIKGYELKPFLFALFCSETEEGCYVRQDFYEVMTRLYVDAYYGQIAAWCREHGIASSGHVLNEEWLGTHVGNHGSLFAAIRRLDLPGIDMLDGDPVRMLNSLGFLTPKQVSSVAHLIGADEVHAECSDWVQQTTQKRAVSPRERIGQGNLLYVMGVNQITSYWGWNDKSEASYRVYNDYMGRLALLLRGGRHICDVALVYPIRAAWATYVPHSPLASANVDGPSFYERLDRLGGTGYAQPVRDLIQSQIDLDIVDEQAMLEASISDGTLAVAQERYRIVVVPRADTLGAATAEKLTAFGQAGGTVIFIDEPPVRGESAAGTARLTHAIASLLASGRGRTVALDRIPQAVREAGADDFSLASPDPDILFTHRQVDGRDLYFVINATGEEKQICPRLRVPGPYDLYRPMTGAIAPSPAGAQIHFDGFEGVFLIGG